MNFVFLRRIRGLGESDSEDEAAAAWVSKNRKLQAERELAEKTVTLIIMSYNNV